MGTKFFFLLVLVVLGASSCSKGSEDPELFLPKVLSPEGADLDALKARYCQASQVNLHDSILTTENFNAIFRCANYDKSLEGLRPLITSQAFPEFLASMNLILRSENTENLRETLRPWLEEGPQGVSRLDHLLPLLAKTIKNPSFQDALPVLSHLLDAGKEVWADLLPGLGEVLYQEQYPDNLEDVFVLFQAFGKKGEETNPTDYAKSVKDLARFLQSQVEGKTVALQVLQLLHDIRNVQLEGVSLYEYLDDMNEKGVVASMFLESGAARGEELSPKLNEDPDNEADACEGLNDTPAQRQNCAYRKLFRRMGRGQDAPIVQLAGMVSEFQTAHPEFLPALARWFSAHGPEVTQGLTEYVVRSQILSNLSKLNVDSYLLQFATKQGWTGQRQVTAEELAQLLRSAFADEQYATWLDVPLLRVNEEALGARNAKIMRGSQLAPGIASLYGAPEISAFASVVIPTGTITLTTALRKFANLHRGEKLIVNFLGTKQTLEAHLLDLWSTTTKETLGESVVVDFVVNLAQTFFTRMANDFGSKPQTLSGWYFSSPYGDPGMMESLAGYAVKDLGLMPKYHKHHHYLVTEFADEVFEEENDKRAFRLLVDQIPNIYLYLKSGMSRSGSDFTRALALKDEGRLTRNYVALLVKAQNTGWIRKGARLIEAYQEAFPFVEQPKPERVDEVEDTRKISLGVDAMKRVLRSLFRPKEPKKYETCTLRQLVMPLSALVGDERRQATERFLLTGTDQLLALSDEEINDFLRDFWKEQLPGSVHERRETFHSIADLLKDGNFPALVHHLDQLFREDAVKPALDFLASKIDDGSLKGILLFLRRILGFR